MREPCDSKVRAPRAPEITGSRRSRHCLLFLATAFAFHQVRFSQFSPRSPLPLSQKYARHVMATSSTIQVRERRQPRFAPFTTCRTVPLQGFLPSWVYAPKLKRMSLRVGGIKLCRLVRPNPYVYPSAQDFPQYRFTEVYEACYAPYRR